MSVYPRISVVFASHQGNFSDRDSYRKPQQSICRDMEPSPSRYIYKDTPAAKAQGTSPCERGQQKDCKSRGIKDLAVRLCLLGTSEGPAAKPHHRDHPNVRGTRMTAQGKAQGPQPCTKNYRKLRKARRGDAICPREDGTNGLSSVKQSALKTCIQVALCGLDRLHSEIYMYVHIHMCM